MFLPLCLLPMTDSIIIVKHETQRVKLKLTTVLLILIVCNILLLQFGPGLGGNYLKKQDSILWCAPLGCVIWGFLLGSFFAFIPYNELPYKKKYLIVSLFISIIFNLFMLVIAISVIFEYPKKEIITEYYSKAFHSQLICAIHFHKSLLS